MIKQYETITISHIVRPRDISQNIAQVTITTDRRNRFSFGGNSKSP